MSIGREIDKGINNTKDALKEAGHRSEAQAEQQKRDLAGDEMTASEKLGSVANQAKNEVQAGVDHTKRDVRNNT